LDYLSDLKPKLIMIIRTIKIAILVMVTSVFTGCLDNDKWEQQELIMIEDYLDTIGDTVYTVKPSGLYIIYLTEGTGEYADDNDTIYFKYKGRYTDNTIFDTNKPADTPYKYIMGSNSIIKGIDEGLRYVNKGGKIKLLTPSKLAYGAIGLAYYVPGYTPVLWDLEVDSIVKKSN